MSWTEVMRRVLPPSNGVSPHVTSPFGASTKRPKGSSNPHGGIDSNYNVGTNGQSGVNLTHPPLYAPVSGVVTNAGQGSVGRIAIKDVNGFSHEILHTQRQDVKIGQKVFAGDPIGTMGGVGAKDVQHIHYQLKDPAGRTINPGVFADTYLDEYQKYLRDTGAISPGEFPSRDRDSSFDNRFGIWPTDAPIRSPQRMDRLLLARTKTFDILADASPASRGPRSTILARSTSTVSGAGLRAWQYERLLQ